MKDRIVTLVIILICIIILWNLLEIDIFRIIITFGALFALLSYISNRRFNTKEEDSEKSKRLIELEKKELEKRDSKNLINTNIDEIRMDMPYFNDEKFLDTARLKMVNLYKALKDNNYVFVDNIVEKNYLYELKNTKFTLFEFGEVDFLTIHGRKIIAYRKSNDFSEIDVRMNAIHIDYMNNNIIDYHPTKKRYLEDMYVLTFRAPSYSLKTENKSKCDRCGAMMQKEMGLRVYTCEYCGNSKVMEYDEWKISNIQRMEE